MKLVTLIAAFVLMVLLPIANGNSGPLNEKASQLPYQTKVFIYNQICNCYQMTFNDGIGDCEVFINGNDTWNNGKC